MKYSIILPVYNGGEYVKECIASILAQTYADFNVIVLDNCSTDGTLEYIKSLKDHRIVIYSSNKALTLAQNWARVKDVKKNEFITLIGHDDLLHRHYLQTMNDLIERHPEASLYQTHFNFINAKGEEIRKCLPMSEIQYAHEFLAGHFTQTMDSMGTGYMMRARDYDKLGGVSSDYPNLIFADYALWIDLTLLSYKASSFKEAFSYRVHTSASRATGAQHYQEAFEKYIQLVAERAKQHSSINETVKRYGKGMLVYYCESLSHRLLKTPLTQRNLRVSDFLKKCRYFASLLIPDQAFEPMKIFRIRIAAQLDNYYAGRKLFMTLKKIQKILLFKN